MISSRPSRRRGNVILEFALAFPLLVLLLSGMYQFGYAFFVYNQLQSAVRTGGRYAATTDFDGGVGVGDSFRSRIQSVVVYGVTSGGTTPVVRGLSTSQVSVTWLADSEGIPQTITVRISGFSFYAVFQTFSLSDKPKATFIYLGQYITLTEV